MARIELDNASITFEVRPQQRLTWKDFVLKGMFWPGSNPVVRIAALQEISLVVGEGQRLGVIGHNGAGKSTLLRMLSGVYPPTSGRRLVEGPISSLFDVALGFELNATGYENILFRGYQQGETPRSIRAKVPEIATFSELGDFLNLPLRCYSAGMLVRLGFAIATAIEPEVLLVDEMLSAGDLAFQEKARLRMRQMMTRARLIVLVSHDLDAIAQICQQALWLDHGRVRRLGPAAEIVAGYIQHVSGAQEQAQSA